MKPDTGIRLWLRLFLPFAAGYFLSYLYRTANAVIGPVLGKELGLSDSALGLLTSTYFLAFGVAQLPLGLLLDRFGPRRVEATLLLIAAAGAGVFALADTLSGLALGRALIGLGAAACLMAALKAFAQWFALERQAAMTGWIMTSGGLGALAAAKPLELAISLVGWREVCLLLAVVTAAVALLIWLLSPDKPIESSGGGIREQLAGLRTILLSRHFRAYAPMGFWVTGGFMAVQGLWASRWMNVMENLSSAQVADRLTWISLAMLGGFLFMGFFATPLVRRGVRLENVYGWAMTVGVACLIGITAFPEVAGGLIWPLLGASFSLSTIAYSLVAKAFPVSWVGRANTAFNLTLFAGAFLLQWGIGGLVDTLASSGWSARESYRAAFITLSTGQCLALFWLFRAGRRL